MTRKAKQKRGYLGHRTHGRGNVKNRRGSGNRGGRGMAGICKHKWSWAAVNAKNYFGKFGFKRPVKKAKFPIVYLYEISQKAALNQLEKKEGRYHFEFDGKVLATGAITVPVLVKAMAWSKGAEEKLKQAGGEISKLKEQAGKAA